MSTAAGTSADPSNRSGIHPTLIAESFQRAATKAVEILTEMSTPVDLNDRETLLRAASTSLNSKVRTTTCYQVFAPEAAR